MEGIKEEKIKTDKLINIIFNVTELLDEKILGLKKCTNISYDLKCINKEEIKHAT